MEHFSPAVKNCILLVKGEMQKFEAPAQEFNLVAKDLIDWSTCEAVPNISMENLKRIELRARMLHQRILEMHSFRLHAIVCALQQAAGDDKFYMRYIDHERKFIGLLQKEINDLIGWDENYFARYENIAMKLSKKMDENGL